VFLFDSEIELIKSLADRSTLLERAGMPSWPQIGDGIVPKCVFEVMNSHEEFTRL
jgi:hypothetical protein